MDLGWEKKLIAINMANNNNIKENCCATTLNQQLRKRFSGLKKYMKLLDKTIYGFQLPLLSSVSIQGNRQKIKGKVHRKIFKYLNIKNRALHKVQLHEFSQNESHPRSWHPHQETDRYQLSWSSPFPAIKHPKERRISDFQHQPTQTQRIHF